MPRTVVDGRTGPATPARSGWPWRRWAAAAVALVVFGAGAWWALRTILAPPPNVLSAPDYTLVTAREGTVQQSLRLNASARWTPVTVAPNQASGVVTTVEVDAGKLVDAGAALYTVDLRPTVVAAGSVPAFRDLSAGMSGADVAQLQRLLSALDFYSGSADGVFGTRVGAAVRAWQRDLGVSADGVVRRGDVIYVPALPARVAFTDTVAVGRVLGGGEPAVSVLPDAPEFTITMGEGHARMVEAGMAVDVSHDGGTWTATVAEVRQEAATGQYVAVLAGTDGPVCGADCASIPVTDPPLLPSVIRVVPAVSGVVLPAAALVSSDTGDSGVLLPDGTFQPVRVVASANGVAVVAGIDAGTKVRAPAGSAP